MNPDLGEEVLQTTMKVEAQSSGVFSNFLTIVGNKTYELFLNIFGGFGYKPKN